MRIGFIGAGNMVSAIVRGAVAAGTPAGHLLLTSKHGSAERLAEQVGAVHVPDAAELVSRSDVLILGLKPYVIPDVLPRLSEAITVPRLCARRCDFRGFRWPSEHHGGDPPGDEQRNVEVQEGRDDRVAHVVVLPVGVEPGRGPQRGVRRR